MKEQQQISIYCQKLGLKELDKSYKQLIDKANKEQSGYYEFLKHVLHQETAAKEKRCIEYRIRESKLPKPYKLLSDFDFSFQAGLNKDLIMDLATLNFISNKESILFIGDCGTGKSHIACALALIACQKCMKVYYTTCSALINDLNTGVYEKTLNKRLRKYASADLLVIDEMGHDRLELQVTKEAHLLFKVIDLRYSQEKSLIFTSNVQQQDWSEFLRDKVTTQAILDRIFHRSVKIEIKGKSYRKYQGEKLQKKYHDKMDKKLGKDNHARSFIPMVVKGYYEFSTLFL